MGGNLCKIGCARCLDATAMELPNSGMTTIPQVLYRTKSLRVLNLAQNRISEISPEIRHLSVLSTLILNCNQISRLPNEIGSLSLLRRLQLSQNRLERLPSTIGELTFLEELDVSHNQVRSSSTPDSNDCAGAFSSSSFRPRSESAFACGGSPRSAI